MKSEPLRLVENLKLNHSNRSGSAALQPLALRYNVVSQGAITKEVIGCDKFLRLNKDANLQPLVFSEEESAAPRLW